MFFAWFLLKTDFTVQAIYWPEKILQIRKGVFLLLIRKFYYDLMMNDKDYDISRLLL